MAEFQAMQQENARLKAQAAAAAAKVQRPKIPPPRNFTGESGTAGQVDDWIEELEKHFRYHGAAAFPDETVQIDFAVMFLQGKAAHWWQAAAAERNAAQQAPLATWAEFLQTVRDRFRPIEASTVARTALDSMRQTGSVQAYADYYHRQMSYIKDMSLADQLHAFTRGLKEAIKIEVLKSKPKSVHDAINTAHLVESTHGPRSASVRSSASCGFGFRSASGSSSAGGAGAGAMELGNVNFDGALDGMAEEEAETSGADVQAMLLARIAQLESTTTRQQQALAAIGAGGGAPRKGAGSTSTAGQHGVAAAAAASSTKQKVPGVSKEDFDRCRRENRCLKCKEVGHVARDCTGRLRLNW